MEVAAVGDTPEKGAAARGTLGDVSAVGNTPEKVIAVGDTPAGKKGMYRQVQWRTICEKTCSESGVMKRLCPSRARTAEGESDIFEWQEL